MLLTSKEATENLSNSSDKVFFANLSLGDLGRVGDQHEHRWTHLSGGHAGLGAHWVPEQPVMLTASVGDTHHEGTIHIVTIVNIVHISASVKQVHAEFGKLHFVRRIQILREFVIFDLLSGGR